MGVQVTMRDFRDSTDLMHDAGGLRRRLAEDGYVFLKGLIDRDLLACRFADGATTQSASEHVGRSVEAVYKALAKIRQALFDCVQRTLARETRP